MSYYTDILDLYPEKRISRTVFAYKSFLVKGEAVQLRELLLKHECIKSGKEFKRLIEQDGLRINGETVKKLDMILDFTKCNKYTVEIGKNRKFEFTERK